MNHRIIISLLFLFLVFFCLSCLDSNHKTNADTIYALIPSYIKDSIYLSPVNPFSHEKANLGRYFFYDRRMSVNQTKSCASCHDPQFSFTDNYRKSIGASGDNVQHNALPLLNIVFNKYLTWADSSIHYPEEQMQNPMFHDDPVELGWKGNELRIIARLKKDDLYTHEMTVLFPGDKEPFSTGNIQSCIASFVKTILSLHAPYDEYRYQNRQTLSSSAMKGMKLFFSKELKCAVCHGGTNFSTSSFSNVDGRTENYLNTGLYNIDGKGSYPAGDPGLIQFTHKNNDMGKYRVPTLRNLAFTAPYFHDGTAENLEDVVTHYENGGRVNKQGRETEEGRKNPYKNPLISGFRLTSQERKDLVNFLLSLSDSSILNNSKYSNPFTEDETKK